MGAAGAVAICWYTVAVYIELPGVPGVPFCATITAGVQAVNATAVVGVVVAAKHVVKYVGLVLLAGWVNDHPVYAAIVLLLKVYEIVEGTALVVLL